LINGRPRAPNVQGLVEQGNGVVEQKIMNWMAEHGSAFWYYGLPEISNQINAQMQSATKT
jgi:hypothetical protein